ncbi:unnamed protein product [Dimorphilus gyrociliatus]|uniref:Uncharacterized protein n=1 Tax=Dimorphilus gyrociliatus TaxID=2664684 RepID=A0A7I8VXJ0_9ANNE|nr:unnamed protein product [Dimorphilus gyrociliatus]
MAVPVAMITVGVKFLHECPIEPKVPIYLLVAGCFGLLKLLSLLWRQVRSRRYEQLDEMATPGNGDGMIMSKSSKFSEAVLSIFLLIWFGFGNYWIFRVWKPNFIQALHRPSDWCHPTVYMFAFGTICGVYALTAIVLLIACMLALCYRLCNTCSSE